MLGTYARALAAVGAASGNMEGADDVEHILLKIRSGSLGRDTGIVVVENALLAGTYGAYVAAGIAADAAGKLAAPECKSLVGRHGFQLFDLSHAVGGVGIFTLVADHFVAHDVYSLAVGEALQKLYVILLYGLVAVKGVYRKLVSLAVLDRGDTAYTHIADLVYIRLARTSDTENVYLLARHAVLLEEHIYAVCIAGLGKNKRYAILFAGVYQVFAEVRAAEFIIYEVCVEFLGGLKDGRGAFPVELAAHPAQNALSLALGEKLRDPVLYQFRFSLHLRSLNFLFSPSSVIVFTKSFITAANLTPSAAETHSTRVRSFSMPR